jgi:hypothetical protein
MRFRLAIVLAALASLAVAAGAVGSGSDTAPLPNTDSLPWTDPNHLSPLEQLANGIGSTIAGRAVRLYCDGDNDWATLAAKEGFDPDVFSSWVVYHYKPTDNTVFEDANIAHMPPRICRSLWNYGKAAQKPTKCPTVVQRTKTVVTTVRVAKRMRVRVKVAGKWKYVWRTVRVSKRVKKAVTQAVEGPPAPCYDAGILKPSAPGEYFADVRSLFELAIDSALMGDLRQGVPNDPGLFDRRSTCVGLQKLPLVARRFGATADDGQSIAAFVDDMIYARWQGSSSWSADCRENGLLDLTPYDGVWP